MNWVDVLQRKADILRNAGYRFHVERIAYVNRSTKKYFTIEWLESHSPEDLSERIAEPNDTADWHLYFNQAPSRSVRSDLIAELDALRTAS